MNSSQSQQKAQAEWQTAQDALAETAGLAVLLVDGKQPPALAVSNNNSICHVIQSSEPHGERCEPFCGKAFDKAMEAGQAINYRCHAGFQCIAAPLATDAVKPLVAIVGRAFTQTSDYRELTERVWAGDFQDLPGEEMFENVLLTNSFEDLERLAHRLQSLTAEDKASLKEFVENSAPNPYQKIAEINAQQKDDEDSADDVIDAIPELSDKREKTIELNLPLSGGSPIVKDDAAERFSPEIIEEAPPQSFIAETDFVEWQASVGTPFKQNFRHTVNFTLQFLSKRIGLEHLAWLERNDSHLTTLFATGRLRRDPIRLDFALTDERLRQAAQNDVSLKLGKKTMQGEKQTIELFPLSVGEETKAALVVGEELDDEITRKRLAVFCRLIAPLFEVVRLREELKAKTRIASAVQHFGEQLRSAEPENWFDSLTQSTADLVGSERVSLLIFDESEQTLRAVGALGIRADDIKAQKTVVGERVASRVWREGKPYLVSDLEIAGLQPAPPDRGYKSNSFISMPLSVGSRRVGVLSVTDKSSGEAFDLSDLGLLQSVAPQIAIALDRAVIQQKAGVIEMESITDSLTKLLNRGYLEERLSEELRRSRRHGYPMSFLMIDVDDFKKYNDTFGHQAGDEALRLVAHCLRAALRSADVAARYGGEEFSILLPQTTLTEAQLIAERIRRRVENTEFPHRKVTISVGIAAYSPQFDTVESIIRAADNALYEAKNFGKNNVRLSEQTYGFGRSGDDEDGSPPVLE